MFVQFIHLNLRLTENMFLFLSLPAVFVAEEAFWYLQVQVVQVLQSGEVQLTNLINHIILEEYGLNRDRKEDVSTLLVETNAVCGERFEEPA